MHSVLLYASYIHGPCWLQESLCICLYRCAQLHCSACLHVGHTANNGRGTMAAVHSAYATMATSCVFWDDGCSVLYKLHIEEAVVFAGHVEPIGIGPGL